MATRTNRGLPPCWATLIWSRKLIPRMLPVPQICLTPAHVKTEGGKICVCSVQKVDPRQGGRSWQGWWPSLQGVTGSRTSPNGAHIPWRKASPRQMARGWGLLAWPCISGLGVIWSLQFPVYLPFTKEAAVMKYRLQVLALKDSTFLPWFLFPSTAVLLMLL